MTRLLVTLMFSTMFTMPAHANFSFGWLKKTSRTFDPVSVNKISDRGIFFHGDTTEERVHSMLNSETSRKAMEKIFYHQFSSLTLIDMYRLSEDWKALQLFALEYAQDEGSPHASLPILDYVADVLEEAGYQMAAKAAKIGVRAAGYKQYHSRALALKVAGESLLARRILFYFMHGVRQTIDQFEKKALLQLSPERLADLIRDEARSEARIPGWKVSLSFVVKEFKVAKDPLSQKLSSHLQLAINILVKNPPAPLRSYDFYTSEFRRLFSQSVMN